MSLRVKKSVNPIQVYEVTVTENKNLGNKIPKIEITEHWKQKAFVVLDIDGVQHTILADELKRAIDNANNVHTF